MNARHSSLDVVCPNFPGSVIAHLTRLAVRELASQRSVRLFSDLNYGGREPASAVVDLDGTGVQVLPISSFEEVGGGLPIFVIAGHPAFARPLGLALRHPGLVIIHDRYLWEAVEHLVEPTMALAILGRRDFTPGLAELQAAWADYRSLETGDRYPGRDLDAQVEAVVARRALHVLTHTEQHARELDPLCLGGASWQPLPSLIPEAIPQMPSSIDSVIPSTATVILSFGVMTWNKCVDRILQATRIGRSAGRDVHVVAAGMIHDDYANYLQDLTTQLDLGGRVHVTGPVSPGELRWLLRRANAVVQLRDPVLNVGTASVVDALAMGKHVLVYDEGVFGTFPDDVVAHVPTRLDDQALWEAIEVLVERTRSEPEEACTSYVDRVHTLSGYVGAVARAVDLAERTSPGFRRLESYGRVARGQQPR